MALILSLETSSEICSVCLHEDENVIAIKESSEAFSHTRKITSFIQECFSMANRNVNSLDAVAVSHGPGSYTGLRVSASTAKGICYALQIPLIAIDTLEAIAYSVKVKNEERKLFIPTIDARRMEVYNCVFDYEMQLLKATHNLILEDGIYDEWKKYELPIVICGTGVEKSKHFFQSNGFELVPFQLSARHLVPLATVSYLQRDFESLVAYEPNYFKAPKVTTSKKKPF